MVSTLKTVLVPALLGVALTGVTATIVYLLFRKEEDEEQIVKKTLTSHQKVIEVHIPKEAVGVVIGRGGSNIKEIQEKTDTKITFKDGYESDNKRVCVIRGTTEDAQLAEILIYQTIANQPRIETMEMWIPQRACGRLIGKNGDNIRSISLMSQAKITIDRGVEKEDLTGVRRVVIKGSAEQIEVAKAAVEEKIAEDDAERQQLQLSSASREPSYRGRQLYLTATDESQNVSEERQIQEQLEATGSDGFMEVYVSAVESAGHFWIQLLGPRAIELDKLVEQISEYYSVPANKELHILNEVNVGDIVAAPFAHDESFYRAKVTAFDLDEYDPGDSQVSVHYVDFGDSGTLQKREIYELRTDFLKLRFQAIECYMANIKPKGDIWINEATDLFQELSHAAEWKVVMLRLVNYRSHEGRKVPCVELIDTRGAQDINVGEELVKQGMAVWDLESVQEKKS